MAYSRPVVILVIGPILFWQIIPFMFYPLGKIYAGFSSVWKWFLGGLWTLSTLSTFPTAIPSFLFLPRIFCIFTFCYLIFLRTMLSKLNVMGVLLSKQCLTKRWKCSRCGIGFLKWKQGLRIPNRCSCLESLDIQKTQKGEGEDLQNSKEKN